MDYKDSLSYLDTLINYERRDKYDYAASFKLDRMRRLASALGDPQKTYKSIHVAGSKGKGSTCSMVFSILKEAGYKTGLYTSPHLVSFTERIRTGEGLISESDMARLLTRIRAEAEKMKGDPPTFFEAATALAYLYFKERGCEFAVFETGLGGRLDATNILEPLVSGITPISYEHTDKLGKTLTEIAGEKAGIIKNRGVCVIAPQETESLAAILKVCSEKNSRAILIGEDIRYKEISSGDKSEVFSVSGVLNDYSRLEIGLLGSHQVANAATAIGVIESLGLSGITIGAQVIGNGLRKAFWPGRLELVNLSPRVVLDGAQNRASARALAEGVKRAFKYKKLILVLGISGDKDIKGILDELIPLSDTVILTRCGIAERAAPPEAIRKLMPEGAGRAIMTMGVKEAVEKAVALACPEDLILATGSLFVAGEARELFVK